MCKAPNFLQYRPKKCTSNHRKDNERLSTTAKRAEFMPHQHYQETDHLNAFFKQDDLTTGDTKPVCRADPSRVQRSNILLLNLSLHTHTP